MRIFQDFGDGGSFPEIHVAQFPLGMGKKGPDSESRPSNALAVQLDADGKIKYDVLARQGHSKDKIVYSKFTDLLPKEITNEDDPVSLNRPWNRVSVSYCCIILLFQELQKPDEEDIKEITEKTRQALEKLTQSKIAAAMPVRCAEKRVSLLEFPVQGHRDFFYYCYYY